MKHTNMLQIFKLGDTIYGYCNGYFGRDDYYDKTCVMVTPRYAVFEYLPDEDNYRTGGNATVLHYSDDLAEYAEKWKKEPDND